MKATKATDPGRPAGFGNIPSAQDQSIIPPVNDPELKDFIRHYCDPVYSCVARLSGLSDPGEIEYLTGRIIMDLWNNKTMLLKEKSPGVFVFRILLREMLIYLKKQGNEKRIQLLQKILLINPSFYLPFIESDNKPERAVLACNFLHKIKRIWKTS